MGMGPKENTAQTPDVETPYTHTQTQTQTHIHKTQIGKGGGNEGYKAALGVCLASCDWLVCSSSELIFYNKQAKDKVTKAWKCQQEKIRLTKCIRR